MIGQKLFVSLLEKKGWKYSNSNFIYFIQWSCCQFHCVTVNHAAGTLLG